MVLKSSRKKGDISKNVAGLEERMKMQRDKEKKLVPLRIDEKTVLLMRKSNCNEKYAEEYRKRRQKYITR